ncbi:hypothetical protein BDW22DRAFT_1425211 [Trametopsis cervina]|nr:hypothetical protein BDW22DRAFT_1425211 [Trametopsis cervina]
MSNPTSLVSRAAVVADHAIKHKGEHDYPFDLWYFIAGVVGVAVAFNVISIVWAFMRRQHSAAPSKGPQPIGQKSLWRLPSAILSGIRIVAFRWRFPLIKLSVLEGWLTAIYLVAILIWEFANTQNLLIKDWSDRSGHIAACQISLIVGLSMKNNVIGYLTGVSHEKLQILHRTIARSLFVMVLIHGFSRVSVERLEITEFGWTELGLAAGIIYAIILIVSIEPIRRRFFEIFYAMHVVLVFALILITYLHVAASNFGILVWPAFVIWGFDRVVRYIRYLYLTDLQSPSNPDSQATLELLSSDTIRITARRGRNVPVTWSAGQHMFLAFPSVGPAESHPFTIATVPNDDSSSAESGKEMVWVIRARDGFTRRIKEYALERNGSCKVPVFMHGPYGAPPDITPYSTCVFIAGGSGITYTLPRMRDLLIRVADGKACARRIVFIWAVRHASHIEWLSSEFTKALATASRTPSLSLTIAVHVTSSAASTPSLAGSTEEDIEKDESGPASPVEKSKELSVFSAQSGVKIEEGRPDVSKILEEAVKGSEGPVSVDVSGPRLLVKSIRETLSGGFASPISVLEGVPTVQLNVETFSM